MRDEDWEVRGAAAEALTDIGEPAVLALVSVLKDKRDKAREWAAWALGEIGNASAVAPLIDGLRDQSSDVRARAAVALQQITKKRFGEDYDKWQEWRQENNE